ncbi:MAG: phosphoribosylformylglycinamidine cyclo-ligase [Cryobacterium sp.]|nr:phosphoribosylformylglycinamidine cyclo-ligase [Oligoflexia bacterium]
MTKSKKKKTLSYADSGVDRLAADRLVERIKVITGGKKKPKALRSTVGGYASLYELSKTQWIAASTDGVGTKLKLAFETGNHATVGEDLVAMSVNDLLCVGAKPLFFLDYFATGKLKLQTTESVISGIQAGCEKAKAILVGGETAEMPGFYAPGEYDLAGFAVGIVDPKLALPSASSKAVRAGDLLIGLNSSGLHSNGYSLVRKLLDSWKPSDTKLSWAKSKSALLRELLIPTQIYTDALLPATEKGLYRGLAHITGSGFLNVPRLGEHVSYEIDLPPAAELPRIYEWLEATGKVTTYDRLTTFNCGLGMIGAVRPEDASAVIRIAKRAGVKASVIGEVFPNLKKGECVVIVHTDDGRFELKD